MKKTTLTLFLLFAAFLSRAQTVSTYTFSESTETYVAVSGINSTAVGDDGSQNAIAIGFPFNFGGNTYTTFSISTNGFIRLGNNIANTSWTNALANASGQAPAIAAFWDDNNRNAGSIQYSLTGSAPNRILEIGWDQINIGNGGNTSAAVASFKMRLYETSGQIDFIYGPAMAWSGTISASVGINDLTSFLSVSPGVTATASSVAANNAISATASLVGRKYTFTPPPPCSSVSVPGSTVSSANPVCAGHLFTLTLPDLALEVGYSFQWQSSTNGVDYANIDGATTDELTIVQTAATYYRCLVSCGVSSAASTPIQVLLSAPTTCYCEPTYTSGKTDGDLISNVVITGTTLSNNTGTAPVNPSYTYFSGQPNYTAQLQVGVNYEIQVTVGSFGQQNSAVWIDYNDDNIFSADEKVGFTIEEVGSFGTAAYNIYLDCTAPGGVHRMRIRDVYNVPGAQIDPCANYGWGETEDYDVTIIPASACAPSLNLGVDYVNAYNAMLEWTAGCGQISWDVHVTAAGGGLPAGEASHPNVTDNPLLVSGLAPATNYEFYVKGHCGSNGDSAWAGPFAFVTGPEPIGNDECETSYSLIPGGNFAEHALTATNAGATKSIGPPAPTCAVFGFGGDVWFSIVVPTSGNITVETQAAGGSPLIDTGLTLFAGECGNLTSLGCSDDEGVDAFSMLSLTGLTPGSTIYARVWEYANDSFGEFRISAWDSSLGGETFGLGGFSFHPNPVTDVLNLEAKDAITQVSVFNLVGQEVANEQGYEIRKIDLSSLAQGAYLVRVTASNHQKTIKIIKQ